MQFHTRKVTYYVFAGWYCLQQHPRVHEEGLAMQD